MNIDPARYGLPFPVGSIFGIGRNYAEHAAELGNAVPEEPVVFLKPSTALCPSESSVWLPAWTGRIDHEVEMVVALSRGGRDLSLDQALGVVYGYAVGLDITARDRQNEAKRKGLPWDVAKGFDTFAPVGGFLEATGGKHGPFELKLTIDGGVRQVGNTADMIFSVAQVVAYLSRIFTLRTGDLIFTGTPAGVGALRSGNRLLAELRDLNHPERKSGLRMGVTSQRPDNF